MIVINEWLPNPIGADAAGEWIELANTGDKAVSLGGWKLRTSNGKHFTIRSVEISPGGYLVLKRSETKLPLKNSDETLSLVDSRGTIIDSSHITGTAQEGMSYSRVGSRFVFAKPTPGFENSAVPAVAMIRSTASYGVPLNQGIGLVDLLIVAVGTAAFVTCAALFITKRIHETAILFFGKN